ncbi:MAG: hypothetical protein K8J08_14095 [Thermoanaerobaculia bacterium]|nr:hypothetical protein [Thermoanaerobaculia bacterium]
MSYEKHVYPSHLPDDLISRWSKAIAEHGLDLTFHPDFTNILTWPGGYLPCRVSVRPGSFVGSERYGDKPLYAGFEFYAISDAAEKAELLDDYEADLEDEGRPLSPGLFKRLRAAPAMFGFTHGGFSWTTRNVSIGMRHLGFRISEHVG